jgi:hypothetical protein
VIWLTYWQCLSDGAELWKNTEKQTGPTLPPSINCLDVPQDFPNPLQRKYMYSWAQLSFLSLSF